MTESEWLASTDPQAMLAWLTGDYSPVARDLGPARVSGRKLRLVACAIFRASVGGTTWSAWSSMAVESAEKFADGAMTLRELQALHAEIPDNLIGEFLLRQNAQDAAESILRHHLPGPHADASGEADAWQLADTLRDIVGNPFRPVVLSSGEPVKCRQCSGSGWIRDHVPYADLERCEACKGVGESATPSPWLTPLVVSLAQGAYDNRLPSGQLDPEILAVLSDALEDAGCPVGVQVCYLCNSTGIYQQEHPWGDTYAVETLTCHACQGERTGAVPHPLLAHLRSPGPHWRGCWAVDLLLEKE